MRTILAIITAVFLATPCWALDALKDGKYICIPERAIEIGVFGFALDRKKRDPWQIEVSGNNMMLDGIVPFVLKEADPVRFPGDYIYQNDDFNVDIQFAAGDPILYLETERGFSLVERHFRNGYCTSVY